MSRSSTRALTAVALAAVIRPLMPDFNMVSAPVVLKQKGLRLTESSATFADLWIVDPHQSPTGGRWRTLAGVVMRERKDR